MAAGNRGRHGPYPPGMSGGSRLTPGGEQVMERARRPPSSRGRRSRRVSAAPLLEGAAEELLHALVRARARDEVPPRRLIGSPGPRSSLSTSPFYHPRRYLRPISPRRAGKMGFVPNKCQIRVDGAKKKKKKACPIRVDWLGGYFFRNCGSIHYKFPFQGNASQIFFILRSCSFTETRARYHPPQHGP